MLIFPNTRNNVKHVTGARLLEVLLAGAGSDDACLLGDTHIPQPHHGDVTGHVVTGTVVCHQQVKAVRAVHIGQLVVTCCY